MKKILSIIVSFILILSLCSCGENTSISPEMKDAGENIVKIVDDYMDGKIDYETASRKLDGASAKASDIYDNGERDEYDLPVYTEDLSVCIAITPLSLALIGENYGDNTHKELLEERNNFAKIIGISKRNK